MSHRDAMARRSKRIRRKTVKLTCPCDRCRVRRLSVSPVWIELRPISLLQYLNDGLFFNA